MKYCLHAMEECSYFSDYDDALQPLRGVLLVVSQKSQSSSRSLPLSVCYSTMPHGRLSFLVCMANQRTQLLVHSWAIDAQGPMHQVCLLVSTVAN